MRTHIARLLVLALAGCALPPPMSGTPGVPGQGWYVAAGGAVFGGLVVAIALIAWMFLSRDDGTQFAAPGRVTVELRQGSHLIWNDYRTTFEGTRYESPQPVPAGAGVRVREASGVVVATRRSVSHEFKTAKTDRAALLAFEVAQPGRYEIAVEGGFPLRVFSVAPDRTLRPILSRGVGRGWASCAVSLPDCLSMRTPRRHPALGPA